MKRQLLLLPAFLAFSATAQQRVINLANTPIDAHVPIQKDKNTLSSAKAHGLNLQKTTAAPRWYSYSDYFDTSETDGGTGAAYANTYLWKDTMGVMAYSSGAGTTWEHNRMVSLGLVTDPAFSGFNDPIYYSGQMKITATDAYSVDSIRFYGIYGFSAANTYVDTIRVAFVYGDAGYGNGLGGPDVYLAKTGNPAVLTTYGATDSMSTYRMHFDTNVIGTNGPTRVVRDLILDNTGSSPAWGDTLSNGIFEGKVGFPDVNIPAGNLIGATLTFISGNPAFTPHDTVFGSTMGYKSNMFRPLMVFSGSTSSSGPSPSYVVYNAANRNSGMFKTLPDTAKGWGGQFIPLWFWSSGGGPSTLQYPTIDFRIKCASCGTVPNSIANISKFIETGAYPNPAGEELNIPFTLAASSNVTVTLSNTLGQTVATREMTNVLKGKVVFNTSKLPPGIYSYTVVAGGQKATGRITIVN